MPTTSHEGSAPPGSLRRRLTVGVPSLVAGAVIVAAVSSAVTWLLTRDSSSAPAAVRLATPVGPVAATTQGLGGFSRTLHQTIYWAGVVAGDRYELTETTNGSIYVRYLPAGVQVGDRRPDYLTVATYPFAHAIEALRASAHGKGSTLASGAFVVADASDPRSVHLAFPGMPYQVEVYAPTPGRALAVARSGRIRAIS
jgi:hypothetical protein